MRRTVAVVVISLVGTLVPVAAMASDVEFTPGAPGIGDPYFPLDGNGGYDVRHYGLALAYDPTTDVLSGTATIEARATQSLSAFNLDFVGLEIEAITVDGDDATWSRDGGELTVTPTEGIRDRRRFTTTVTYAGVPETIEDIFGTSGFFHTDDGALVIGQPDVAATWFPANDHPLDEASFTFAITAPTGLEVVANGALEDESVDGDWTTTTWDAREAMAPYLAMMAIGEFAVNTYRDQGITYWDALDPKLFSMPSDGPGTPSIGEVATGSLARQAEITDFLASMFGRYPFRTSGGIVDVEPRLFFALENQTRPIYASGFFTDSVSGDGVVVHEITHQWYGNDVALEGWQHIWLNEGFATYAEWLWSEHDGLATAQETFDDIASIPAGSGFWTLTIGDPGPENIFDGAIYFRGAMTLHALRLEVGDADFFRIVRLWAAQQRGDNVTTEEFIALAERISRQDLGDFFQTWLVTPQKPAGLG